MFTGLIEDLGKIVTLERRGAAARLNVVTALPLAEIRLGDSIAVNGVCLTVVAMSGEVISFDVSPETLQTAGFARLSPGRPVNLERALRLSDRLGGHLVTGHIDAVARVSGRREDSGNIVFSFKVPGEIARFIVPKGSIAIDGISLTVNMVEADSFSVNIIPHTADKTTLSLFRVGDEVNIETDIIGKYVQRLLGGKDKAAAGLTMQSLLENGFG
jgi:riboflavin synthase